LKFGKQELAAPAVSLVFVVEPDGHQVARVFIRKGLEESVVHNAEDGGGCADAEGEDENGDEGEAAISCEAAKSKAKVARKNFQVIFQASFAAFLFETFEAAEFDAGATAGLIGAQAGSDIASDLLLDVELELGVEAPFG
jgi:hypothetical protein